MFVVDSRAVKDATCNNRCTVENNLNNKTGNFIDTRHPFCQTKGYNKLECSE